MIDAEKLLSIAKEAAFEAGEIQLVYFGKQKEITYKTNEFDLVTNVDKMVEDKVLSIIKGYFPEHEMLGEESGAHGDVASDYLWIIDPIDGTTNYAHNFPHFAISIGLLYQGNIFLGVVYDAFKNEIFWAGNGMGAYLNAEPIKVSAVRKLDNSLLSTGFPYERSEILEESLKYFNKFVFESQAIRRTGSAALDLCYVACGRLDGFWELNLAPWDVTAGACIIQEAGGKVTNFGTNKFDICIKNIIASNKLLHQQIVDIIELCKKT
ncbi:MAG: inositol monophosphatase family protein [bacterium]